MDMITFSIISDYNDGIVQFIIVIMIAASIFSLLLLYMLHIEAKQKEKERAKKQAIKDKIHKLSNNALELKPFEFFELRNKSFDGKSKYVLQFNFAGVYILYNSDKDLYYVGQGKKVLDRVNNHFTGKGNGDVYADYKYGDNFKIKMIALENSGFETLNELERHMINAYDACERGYNKTRGNAN